MASTDVFPGQWQPQVVLMAALQVGLIGVLLDEPRPPAQVAQELALDERAALRVIAVLVDAGYLEKRGDEVVVAPETRALLDPADDAFVGPRLGHLHDLLVRWLQLPEVLRKGGPARLERSEESLRAFIGAMRVGARQRARPLAGRLAALSSSASSSVSGYLSRWSRRLCSRISSCEGRGCRWRLCDPNAATGGPNPLSRTTLLRTTRRR